MFGFLDFSSYGYVGLFVASFLASTLLPFGSEGLLTLLILNNFNLWAVVLVASVGNYLGACTSYYIGLRGRGLNKYLGVSDGTLKKAEVYFNRFGAVALLFTWLPVVGDAIAVSGGLLRFRFLLFSILVFAGKFARYVVVAGAVSFAASM
jgi:membrane protein YqaA with SNARE-associated domain